MKNAFYNTHSKTVIENCLRMLWLIKFKTGFSKKTILIPLKKNKTLASLLELCRAPPYSTSTSRKRKKAEKKKKKKRKPFTHTLCT